MRSIAPGAQGDDVRDVQARLGSVGYRTEPDAGGTYGSHPQAAVRAREALRGRAPATLRNALVAIDAGHGSADPGAVGPTGLLESNAVVDLAEAVSLELSRRGADPFLLRRRDEDPSVTVRARLANSRGAEVLLSLHLNSHDDPNAEGATVFYCGREGWASAG